MLFNSYEFLFLFMPLAVGGYFFFGSRSRSELANVWLVLVSLFFYSYWNALYLPLLLLSIGVNYAVSGLILRGRAGGGEACRRWLLTGIVFNAGLLGYFKYTDFFLENMNMLGASFNLLHIILPLGISFFTLTQVAYLVDCYRGEVALESRGLVNYALFVSFFPHLLAGPILYHGDMMRQFSDATLSRVNWENMARGSAFFIIGLAKKTIIADSLAPFVNASYSHVGALTLIDSWLAAICYMMQLFFDFSGYSDMAIGLALMLNIRIPFNFRSPYRAYGIADFWRRWHISLGTWVKNYLYIPLGGNRAGEGRTLINLFICMVIVGFWHGAGWTFIVWGALHGAGLVVNRVWKRESLPMWRPLGYALTLLTVLVGWVFFRAASVGDALTVLTAMAGGSGLLLPKELVNFAAMYLGITTAPLSLWYLGMQGALLAVVAVVAATVLPSSQEIVARLRFSYRYALVLAVLMVIAITYLSNYSEFLYFQF